MKQPLDCPNIHAKFAYLARVNAGRHDTVSPELVTYSGHQVSANRGADTVAEK